MVEEEEANSAKQLILLVVRPASFCIPSQMREGKKVKANEVNSHPEFQHRQREKNVKVSSSVFRAFRRIMPWP